MTTLDVTRWGEGVPAVLVHGSLASGTQDWFAQQALGDHGYELLVVDRRGYGASPDADGEDFLTDADDIAELLAEQAPDGAHLVGHSYGAIVALYAANQRPDLVRSLTVVEPPAFGIAEHPAAQALADDARRLWGEDIADRTFLHRFLELLGEDPAALPDRLLDALERNVAVVRNGHQPWEADPPLAGLADHDLPVMVVSGGHSDAFDAVCEVVEVELGARREVLPGAQHEIPMLGQPFNELLMRFWREVDGAPPDDDFMPLA